MHLNPYHRFMEYVKKFIFYFRRDFIEIRGHFANILTIEIAEYERAVGETKKDYPSNIPRGRKQKVKFLNSRNNETK